MGQVSQKLCEIGVSKCMSFICQSYISCNNLSNKCFPKSHYFLKLKRTLRTRVLQHLDPYFAKHFGIKGPKEKGQKRGKKKRSKGKALGVVLGPHPPPISCYFFFPIGDKWKIQEKEGDDNAFVLGMVTSMLFAIPILIIVKLIL